jgi:lysophospholipase L1-like esterase
VSRTHLRVAAAAGLVAAAALSARASLRAQAAAARRTIGKPFGEHPHASDGVFKKKYGDRLHLLLVGDSIAAGLGATDKNETLGAHLARRIAQRTRRSVALRTVAVVGSETTMLAGQLATLETAYRPDVAVIVVGGNDVIHRVPVSTSIEHLGRTIEALQELGAVVVVGTCPDLSALTAVPRPLRTLGAIASRQLAAAQFAETERRGAIPVPLARVVGPFFAAQPDKMFAEDRFHPSGAGYRRTAKALVGPIAAALGAEGSDSSAGIGPMAEQSG